MKFLTNPPRHLFFTGKGGVGKTSIACATAVTLASPGHRVLLVSTDPASNIAQVFGVTIGNTITAIPGVPGLDALEIDPEQAAQAYRDSIIAPVRELLPAAEIAAITEQLSGSCTTEVAAFNEFTAILADEAAYQEYDHIVFDTAPPVTRSACCNSPAPGPDSWKRAKVTHRASGRSPDSTSSAPNTPERSRPLGPRAHPSGAGYPGATRRGARTRAHLSGTRRHRNHSDEHRRQRGPARDA